MAASFTRRLVQTGLCLLFSSAWVAGCSQVSQADSSSEVAATAPPAALAVASPIDKPALISAAAPAPAARPFAIQSVLQPDQPISAGGFAWNSDGVPPGPILIAVDLGAQRLYAYRGGVEIGRSSILYGADDKPTPTGTFPILQKKRHHISNLYGAPMPYMMRLTMDGVALHASEVEDGSATHGCIGLPDEFAALLFAEAKLGDRVIIAEKWMREVYYPKATEAQTV